MAIEEPPFRVLQSEPPFEHRLYTGFVVAETDVVGDFDAASRSGFRRVAGYIFGDNQAPSGGNRKIKMTAPVTVEPKDQGWRLHFVMPSAESLSSLPKPNNPDVKLRQVPEHAVAAIRFSGFTTQAAVQEQTNKLRHWISSKQLEPAGPAQVARYNDPFTLPWRRRNEILIPVAPQR
ncbi:MAG: heme-binding protein [Betaproteobacteria bacterium]|nr:heme-binding protein [Betaproteobacteria bacterium]